MSKIDDIKRAKIAGRYTKYIDYIRYPKYKNLQKDSAITFDFPITVLVGKNGSGKSSILKSLYGCIEGKNISDFWFSTHIDPIQEGRGENRNCFIYNYPSAGVEAQYEVLVQRGRRKGKPDYWETSKPVIKYGMLRNAGNKNYRKAKLVANLVYIDFHSVISAFDKYKYFLGADSIIKTNKYLRTKSKELKQIFDNKAILRKGKFNAVQNTIPIDLSRDEITEIKKILGKNYTIATVVEHRLFKLWGQSILFKNNELAYSEAFAGSGETAVITLVKKIMSANNNSIILLDEPETCLHPGAQKMLFEFLLNQCIAKGHQIIISTHSKEFVKNLPNNAIKVFNELPNNNIEIINECSYSSAFFYIGEDIENKKTIIVEDKLSKEIIRAVAYNMGDAILNQINIQFPSGGSKEIKKNIAWYTKLDENNKYIIFDGDELLNNGQPIQIFDTEELIARNRNVPYLENIIKTQTCIDDLRFFSFNSNENAENKINAYIDYLNFYRDNVKFLPGFTPEEIIWDDELAFSIPTVDADIMALIQGEHNFKNKFRVLSKAIYREDSSEMIFTTQKMFITRWLNNNESVAQVRKIINEIID